MRKIEFGNILLQKTAPPNDIHFGSAKGKKADTESTTSFKDMIKRFDIETLHQLNVTTGEETKEKHKSGSFDVVNETFFDNNLRQHEDAILSLEDLHHLLLTQYDEQSDLQLEEYLTEEIVVDENDIILENVTANVTEQNDLLIGGVQDELNDVITELSLLLQLPTNSENITKSVKHVNQLFHLWANLAQDVKQHIKENNFFMENETEEIATILNELIQLFEKRSSFSNQQIYQFDATVTESDVRKWLQQALEKYTTTNKHVTNYYISSNQPLQMSNIEQYTFQATDLERIDAISRNLVTDLSKMINRSIFLKQPGIDQLTFTLRPASLGEVTIRLVQVNGEMTVKFFVTTQAARELFESNLNHLKPMFAPHQISIERDASVTDESFYEDDNEQLEEEQKQNKQHNREHKNDESNESEVSFDDLLHLISEEAVI